MSMVGGGGIDALPDDVLAHVLMQVAPEETRVMTMRACRRWRRVMRAHHS